ncbi:MAG: hypothetical protein R3B84_04360 [Zavarzinella sp.]
MEADLNRLKRDVANVNQSARLVPLRGLRRIVRETRYPMDLVGSCTHEFAWAGSPMQITQHLSLSELGLQNDLPSQVLLIAIPDEHLDYESASNQIQRHLFHILVDEQLDQWYQSQANNTEWLTEQIRLLGVAAWSEISLVLLQDKRIGEDDSPWLILREFLTMYLELEVFSPHMKGVYFPGIPTWEPVQKIIPTTIDLQDLRAKIALPGVRHLHEESTFVPPKQHTSTVYSKAPPEKLLELGKWAEDKGNLVRAAICFYQAKESRGGDLIRHLVQQLADLLHFDIHQKEMLDDLLPQMLPFAVEKGWPLERRMLYDLQRVVLALRSNVFRIRWLAWITSFGKKSLKTPVPYAGQLQAIRRLRLAAKHAESIRFPNHIQEKLFHLMEVNAHHLEEELRTDLEPLFAAIFEEVGLKPTAHVLQVSLNKLIQELLDVLFSKGFLRIGDLRDAIARNRLKLPDLRGPLTFFMGDPLLKADRAFARDLPGIYQPGEFYMRGLQRGCSLFFGTRLGRLFTLFIGLPVGGAYIIVEGLTHSYHAASDAIAWFTGTSAETAAATLVMGGTATAVNEHLSHQVNPYLWWELGFTSILLLLFIHVSRFRWHVGRTLKKVLITLPRVIVNSPVLQAIWKNPIFRFFRRYLVIPIGVGMLVAFVARLFRLEWGDVWMIGWISAGLTTLILRTAVGRQVEDRMNEAAERIWKTVSVTFILAVISYVLWFFQWAFNWINRAIYAVDELLRFREGESRFALVGKILFGTFWGIFTYIFRFCWNLLVEPQINPIKHFPVVTVSHKMLVPLVPSLAKQFGVADATMLGIVSGIPGVFGFLVWELKENWKLYEANLPKDINKVIVGSHGESVRRLLRPGFHSGVIPKTQAKLRKAFREHKNEKVVKLKHQLDHSAEAVHRVVDRLFVQILNHSNGWTQPISVNMPHLGTNTIWLTFERGDDSTFILVFEELNNWLVARIEAVGWVANLTQNEHILLHNALSGLYKYCGIDLIREHWAHRFGPVGYHLKTDLDSIRFRNQGGDQIYTYDDGEMLLHAGQSFPARELVYSFDPLSWKAWEEAWEIDPPVDSIKLMPEWQMIRVNGESENRH